MPINCFILWISSLGEIPKSRTNKSKRMNDFMALRIVSKIAFRKEFSPHKMPPETFKTTLHQTLSTQNITVFFC